MVVGNFSNNVTIFQNVILHVWRMWPNSSRRFYIDKPKILLSNVALGLNGWTFIKNWRLEKEKIFTFGHFTTISGHFFANYISIFHKTEIQTVILRCLVCLNLNWIKSYDIIIGWNKFFHAWKYRSKFLHLRRKTAVIFSIWLFFQNSLVMS